MRVTVLGGGRSSEHEVSLASAASIAGGLREAGHEVDLVVVGRDGVWRRGQLDLGGQLRAVDGELTLLPGRGLADAEVVFPALHGPFGEDGTVQGLLECLDVPYVGSGVLASALCMDKVLFKELMARAGVPQVAFRAVHQARWRSPGGSRACLAELAQLGLPVFVKPARLGSSVGIARVARPAELEPALNSAFAHDPLVIVEAAAGGIEVECSVLGNERPIASQPGEIVLTGSRSGWYDYASKYTPGGMRLIVPARVDAACRERVRELALEVFALTGCSGLARVDFFVCDGEVLVNELNTMPGFTRTSVYGALFAASGIPYAQLLDRLVALALERHQARRAHRF
jgi:D-alanine-D-alanine ligase